MFHAFGAKGDNQDEWLCQCQRPAAWSSFISVVRCPRQGCHGLSAKLQRDCGVTALCVEAAGRADRYSKLSELGGEPPPLTVRRGPECRPWLYGAHFIPRRCDEGTRLLFLVTVRRGMQGAATDRAQILSLSCLVFLKNENVQRMERMRCLAAAIARASPKP